jgi:twitching motility protein PilT
MQLDQILIAAVRGGASDVVLKTGSMPKFRFRGDLIAPSNATVITPEMMMAWLQHLLPADRRDLRKERDFAYQASDGSRFRINAFMQRGSYTIVARVVLSHIRSLSELQMPATLTGLGELKRGLVLVTGVTGSGKSTTLAAMIQQINQSRPAHIVTIEDPIEYLIADKLATIEQREVGIDTESFGSALRAAMRQNPDVIMVGELRDQETAETALRAAETGHLVLSTLHTSDASESLNRIIGMFPPEQTENIRRSLASSIAAIISQRLVPRADGRGMIAVLEILIGSPAVKEQILKADDLSGMRSLIKEGKELYGMQSFDDALLTLVTNGIITKSVAIANATSAADLELRLSGVGE